MDNTDEMCAICNMQFHGNNYDKPLRFSGENSTLKMSGLSTPYCICRYLCLQSTEARSQGRMGGKEGPCPLLNPSIPLPTRGDCSVAMPSNRSIELSFTKN